MRRAARRDANEGELVIAAEQLGAFWVQGPPLDGWCLWRERWTPVEIKRPDGPQGGRYDRHYTPAQVLFLACCKERNAPVWTWRTLDCVLKSLNGRIAA